MKNYIKKIGFLFLSLTLLLGACETEESLTITTPDAEFVLETPGISNIFLNFATPDNPAFTITWKDEVSNSTNFTVEMSTDVDFTSPVVLGSTDKNNFSMTVMQFNDVLKSSMECLLPKISITR